MVEQAVGLVLLGVGDALVEGECLAVVGFGLGWFPSLMQAGGEVA